MSVADKALIERLARAIGKPGDGAPPGVTGSILMQSATSYVARPVLDETTVPTGFDPVAAALFEAVVEAAYLVSNSDGIFDDDERAAFQAVVLHACNDLVHDDQIEALVTDLKSQLVEDGIEKRTRMVARTITRPDHQHEVLRIAALVAYISGGVSEQERAVLDYLASGFALDPSAVQHAIDQAQASLEGVDASPAA